jgi:nitroimidazol reductase NimA-like FMN-containing flavoprotein (pyridoxamine 5'-phosphate oxidase superfamily)
MPAVTHSPQSDPLAPPRVRELARAECEALLARARVGRLAYVHHGQVGITPLHVVYHDGWVYGRTAPGEKLAALRHHPWVALEVDEVEGTFAWRSVVVRGAFYVLQRDGAMADRARWEQAAALLRELVPGALTPADPAPWRDVVFRIHVGEITGRAAEPEAPR